jgi:hypothetical protein
MKLLKSLTMALAALALLLTTQTSLALDRVTMSDGTVLEGEITEETDAYIVIKVESGGLERTIIRVRGEIDEIEYDIDAVEEQPDRDSTAETAKTTEQRDNSRQGRSNDASSNAIPDGATKVAFLRTSSSRDGKGMVGPYLNGNALSEAADILRELPEEEVPDIVVLEIDSGGGAVAELDDIIYAIHDDMKKDFRVVAWIRYAISGAAFTAMNCEEIVFMSSGQMGGNVAYYTTSSGTQALEGLELERMLEYGRRVARNGRIDPNVMWAMQVFMTLSCDIDADGRVTWYDDDRGEYMVSPEDKILTLNALEAQKYKVSKGTADNKKELMNVLGVTEWVEVGHDADEYLSDFRDNVWKVQARMNELFNKAIIAVNLAQNAGDDDQEVGKQVGKARRYLGQLRSLVRRAPSTEKYQGLTPEIFETLDELLRERKFDQFLEIFNA